MDLLDDDSRAVLLEALESCAQSASAGPGGPVPAPATPILDGAPDCPYRPPDPDDIMDDAESCYDDFFMMCSAFLFSDHTCLVHCFCVRPEVHPLTKSMREAGRV
jgi:hypothetical protein